MERKVGAVAVIIVANELTVDVNITTFIEVELTVDVNITTLIEVELTLVEIGGVQTE